MSPINLSKRAIGKIFWIVVNNSNIAQEDLLAISTTHQWKGADPSFIKTLEIIIILNWI